MIAELRCSNCNRQLDQTDKYCRECGLPTVHRSETQRIAAAAPPDVAELKRAMDVSADPATFGRAPDRPARNTSTGPELTTGGVVQVTNPTLAAQMAGSTLLMVGLIVILIVIGTALIVLALRF